MSHDQDLRQDTERSSTPERWLVVGLGNPEDEYGGTRHNVGADTIRLLARREHRSLDRNKRIRCEEAQVRVGGAKVALVVPMSYMNLSGGPVQQAAAWFGTEPDRIVVAHDDLDVEVGAIRVKCGGGHAGHNGLKDIDRALGTREYHRVRIGIGRPPGRMAGKDFVLRRFSPPDREQIDVALEHAADAVELLIREGLEPTQNRYHGR